MTQSDISLIESALQHVNLACVIDHSGRAGNAFFLTIFDQHPTVLACPLMHYTYSYLISNFDKLLIPSNEAKAFLTQKSYFRLLYDPFNAQHAELIHRMGTHDNVVIQFEKIRQYCDHYFDLKDYVSRKELAMLPFLFYALAHNKDISKIKYILISDAISLRTENVNSGYSGKVIDAIVKDFPDAKLFSLVRDPRATFASPRHQYVNWLGNMYSLKPGLFFTRLKELWSRNLQMDNTCVFLFWLLYLAQSAKTISSKKNEYKNLFYTVRNEDLNTDFYPTIQKIALWLDTIEDPRWNDPVFSPSILGLPWHGTGAYNSRYQTVTNGRLLNEPNTVSEKIAGPNVHVTQRWKERLNKREIRLIERLFKEELLQLNYPILYDKIHDSDLKNFLLSALLPFEGETPTLKWIKNGLKESITECLHRLYYSISFIPFYFSSRIILSDYIFRKKVFKNIC